MTHLSLFSGIGGIDLAAEWAGFQTVAFVERDKFCQKVLAKHWPNTPIYDDITTFDGTPYRGITLVSGGFPCQDISQASRNTFAQGIEGHRSGLFWQALRVIKECKPDWVLLENVYQITTRGLDTVQRELVKAGYAGWCFMVGAGSAGAPHIRKRIFMVAHANSDGKPVVPKHDETPIVPNYARLHWECLPSSVRVDDGVSRRLDADRLRALGNAVVPQQVYPILKAIAEAL